MRAHTPPFTKPEAAYDSRRLYDETSAIAAAQDARLATIGDTESKVRTALSYLHHAQLLLKDAFPYTSAERVQKTPEPVNDPAPKWDPKWLGEQAKRTSSALAMHDLQAEVLRGLGIGDVAHSLHLPTSAAHPQHPLRHVVLDERTPEDKL